jgi:hypothetical protein
MPTKNTTPFSRTCPICGTSFMVQPRCISREARYCSRNCHTISMRPSDSEWQSLHQVELDFFWSRIDKTESCWIWTGAIIRPDIPYGRLRIDGALVLAHRFSYQLHKGPIPDGLILDHLCRNPRCVKPDHLEPVTILENNLRGNLAHARRNPPTHCPHGHLYTPETSIYEPGGTRICRICKRASARACYARNRSMEVQNKTTT